MQAGRGAWQRTRRLELVTTYRQRVRHASPRRAEVDVEIERIELFQRGRFLGEVHHLPRHLRRVTARIFRGDRVTFDRDLFLVGAPGRGFELVATRHYDGYVLGAYERGHEVDAGRLDFRRGRVVPVRYSRLFDPYGRSPLVPVPLVPDDPDLLLGYAGAPHGRHTHYSDDYLDRRLGDPYDRAPYSYGRGSDDVDVYFCSGGEQRGMGSGDVEVRTREQHLRRRQGDDVLLRRQMQLERVE